MVSPEKGEFICFRNAVFGLAGYLSFLHTSNFHPTSKDDCVNSALTKGLSNYILDSYNALDTLPPTNPSITLISRRGTSKARKFVNENEIIKSLTGTDIQIQTIDLATISFENQV